MDTGPNSCPVDDVNRSLGLINGDGWMQISLIGTQPLQQVFKLVCKTVSIGFIEQGPDGFVIGHSQSGDGAARLSKGGKERRSGYIHQVTQQG